MTPVLMEFLTTTGGPLSFAGVEIRLTRSDYQESIDGVLMPRLINVVTGMDGKALVLLMPSNFRYHVTVYDTLTDAALHHHFYVPIINSTGVVLRLQDLIVPDDYTLTGGPFDSEVLIEILAAKANTLAARDATFIARDEAVAAAQFADDSIQVTEDARDVSVAASLTSVAARDIAVDKAQAAHDSALLAEDRAAAALQSATYAMNDAAASLASATTSAVSAAAGANSAYEADLDANQASTANDNAQDAARRSYADQLVSTSSKDIAVAARDVTVAARDVAVLKADQLSSQLYAFNEIYIGKFAVAPTVDGNGNPLKVGAIYENTVEGKIYQWESDLAWHAYDEESQLQLNNATLAASNAAASAQAALTRMNTALQASLDAGNYKDQAAASQAAALQSEANANQYRLLTNDAMSTAVNAKDTATTKAAAASQSAAEAAASAALALQAQVQTDWAIADPANKAFIKNKPLLASVATSGNKADVGLANVDNTADTAKPVSQAGQAALNQKENLSSRNNFDGYPGLAGYKIALKTADGGVVSYLNSIAASLRIWNFPDKDGTVAMTSDITGNNSGVNTGDETQASILAKLGSTVVTGNNTGDETFASIMAKLGKATTSTPGYLTAADWNTFNGKVNLAGDTMVGKLMVVMNTPAVDSGFYTNGHVELRTANGSFPSIGFHRVGYTAVALYHDGGDSLRMRNAGNNDYNIWHTGNLTSLGQLANDPNFATVPYVDAKVAALVASAPGTLDTLKELADAIGDDPNFATTITQNIATKMPIAGGTFSGPVQFAGGMDLTFRATAGGDAGDVVWLNADGSEKHRLWDNGAGTLYYRANGGVAQSLLHSGNITNYAPTLTGAGASGNWNISAAETPLLRGQDTRNVVRAPFANSGPNVHWDFMAAATDGLNDPEPGGSNGYHGVLTLQQWTDKTGGGTKQLAFTNNDNMWLRGSGVSDTAYGAWKLVMNHLNVNMYAPTLTGGNASGTWPINITGLAVKASTLSAGGGNSTPMTFNWQGNATGLQPTWLWGGNDGQQMYVYNPANFSVANANTVGNISPDTAGNGNTVVVRDSNGCVHASSDGFASETYSANVRNPIWRFKNSEGFGISYYQGTAGRISTQDGIGFHFGASKFPGNMANFYFEATGVAYFNQQKVLTAADMSTAAAASTVVQRTVDGDIYARYLSSSDSGNAGTDNGPVVGIMAKIGQDNLLRSTSPTRIKAYLNVNGLDIYQSRADKTFDIPFAQEMRWKNFGNGHSIFDASNGTAPNGAAISNTDSQIRWAVSYPTLMGWNGSNTYGVRVDRAAYAENLTSSTLNRVGTAGVGYGDYGSINVSGQAGAYGGICYSDFNVTMMVNANTQGAFRNNNTWLWRFDGGVLAAGTVPGNLVTGTVPNASNAGQAAAVNGLTIAPRLGEDWNGAYYRNSGFYGNSGQPANVPYPYASMITAANSDVGMQIAGGYNSDNLYFRSWYNSGGNYLPWRTVISNANIGAYAAGSAPVLTGPARTNGTDGWFRSTGSAGWFNETYGTGLMSTAAGQVQTYNNSRVISNQGSAQLPAFAFGNDTDTGLFSSQDGVLCFAVNAVLAGYWSGTTLISQGDIGAVSDPRLKKNWVDLPSDFIERWAEVQHGTYERIDSGKIQLGLNAKDVYDIVPEATPEDKDGYLALNYGQAAAVATVQLAQRVVQLEDLLRSALERIEALENQ